MARNDRQEISNRDIAQIMGHLNNIQYGTVTLIVQDGKLVRIEKLEKFKMDV